MPTTLYAHRLSQPSRAVEILTRELGIEVNFQDIDFAGGETRTEWFAAINPFQTVPALVVESDGQRLPLAESQAIMTYLCRTASDRELAQRWYPGEHDVSRSARIDQWLAWHHGNVRRFDMFHHIMNLHMTLPMLKREIQATLLQPLQEGLRPELATLEGHFKRQQASAYPPTLLGDKYPTIADLAMGCELYQLRAAGYRFDGYPRVAAWLAGLAEREHFRAVSKEIDAQGREIREQSGEYLALDTFG
ncbi:glutathione S-transferase family protein [Kushneria phosphatilytica]|uniref:Glutathione S-transferase family protein n=1 Tax=Kushneria phosphatilytica TaxID=657387 RepID=A0A1S1NNE2_9GAMM|nr:glutathione S-transferase family protein [Kushneria phosphatilytica]OHV08837.1 glutathione S-transferase [Kushneria phosphatilytica]QEL12557.1 glutathione S-transferase family protein [Kushneria phosphatilytica]